MIDVPAQREALSNLVDPVDGLITAEEAALLACVSRSTIRTWVRRGHLAPVRMGPRGCAMFRPVDVARAEKATREAARRR